MKKKKKKKTRSARALLHSPTSLSYLFKVRQHGRPVLQAGGPIFPRRALGGQHVADQAADPAGAAVDEEAL